jgi:branched-chain amino acid transport system permease protein
MTFTLVQVIVSGLLIGAVYALFSSGLTLIWGMMNVVNFAHGDFVMLGMYAAFVTMVWLHGGTALAGIAAAILLLVVGVVVYYGLIRQIMRGPMLAQILSTFGLALFIRYAAFWLFSANFVTLPEGALGGTVTIGGIYLGMPQLIAGIVAITLTGGMYLLLVHTTLGSQLLAVSEDRQAAMLMGIRPDRMQALAWGLASASAGIAGALMAAIYPISPTIGETLALTAFVVVTFGGFGSVPGALLAGLVIGVVQALSAFWFGPIYRDVAVYALFVLMLWVRPQGLLGKA